MKNILTILVVLLTAYTGFAQQYVPMPTGNAAYQYRSTYGHNPLMVTDALLMIDGSDTTVHGKVYKKIMARCWDTVYTNYVHAFVNRIATRADYLYGLVREDNKKVYYIIYQQVNFWGPDADTAEHLQYDFNLGMGDTTPTQRIIIAIDSVQVNGTYRKRYAAKGIYSSDTMHIIEGAGMQEEGQTEISLNGMGGLHTSFICLREGTSSNSFDTAGACMHLWPFGTPVSVAQTEPEHRLAIYPNPFTDELYISCNTPANALFCNSMGQVVVQAVLNDGKTRISTTTLAAGIYYLKLVDKDGRLLKAERVLK